MRIDQLTLFGIQLFHPPTQDYHVVLESTLRVVVQRVTRAFTGQRLETERSAGFIGADIAAAVMLASEVAGRC